MPENNNNTFYWQITVPVEVISEEEISQYNLETVPAWVKALVDTEKYNLDEILAFFKMKAEYLDPLVMELDQFVLSYRTKKASMEQEEKQKSNLILPGQQKIIIP